MVMWPWPCESKARNTFPHSEGTHTRWKDCPSFACFFIWIFVVFWHQSTLCKVINQAVNSVNSDLPAFSSVQATSLWRVSYHRRTKSLSEKSGTRERKPALWHVYHFITNNHASFHFWWKENLLNHQKVWKYYKHNCWLNRKATGSFVL